MYASIAGLAAWRAMTEDALRAENPNADMELAGVERRMLAYILPRSPCDEQEKEAFSEAVYWQYQHEQSQNAKMLLAAGGRLSAFQIGNWQASLRAGSRGLDELFPAGLSPVAHSVLLEAGLLYKGGISTC